MRWPWQREPEKRAQPYTDALVSLITQQAAGTVAGDPGGLAALEAAAGLYSAAFSGASVSPAEARSTLTAPYLSLLARNLIRHGEDVHRIAIEGGRVVLRPAGSWDVRGGPEPETWWYRLSRFGPSGDLTELVPGASVVHARYATDASRPWNGVPPLSWARSTASLAAGLEQRLGEEAAAPTAHLVPIPQDGGAGETDDPLVSLKADIAGARGRTLLVETTASGWGEGKSAAPAGDYKPQRIGASPPATLPSLRTDAARAVLGACQVPEALFTDADGTAQRESWRRWALGPLAGLAAVVEAELSAKLDMQIRFDFSGLWARDLQGRASAFKALTSGGMSPDKAMHVAGLDTA